MEILSRPGIPYVGDSNSPQQNSGTELSCDVKSNCLEHEERAEEAGGGLKALLPMAEMSQEKHRGESRALTDEMPFSEGYCSRSSILGCEVDGQSLPCEFHDLEDDQLHAQNQGVAGGLASESSHITVDTIESELPSNNREEELIHSETEWLENDESMAVWVKWRGKWQSGIRCSRADWPLSTVKAKPTHDRKKYFVVYFPKTRNYSWADVLLVRPITELPQPIAYSSHYVGVKMVKDPTIARRFIMQKLAVSMLSLIDQLHIEALSETARNVTVWKEFAVEASRCKSYFDLGKMLLKLNNMILQRYLNSDWLQHSLQIWMEQCQNAHSAESVELLKEELNDSILWNEVHLLPNAPMQPESSSEWRTWKHEVMKCFSTSHPISSSGDLGQPCDDPSSPTPEISRKRPKLEVRRAESHASHVEKYSHQPVPVEIDSGYFDNRDTANAAASVSGPSKENFSSQGPAPAGFLATEIDKWDKIVVEAGNSGTIQRQHVEFTPVDGAAAKIPLTYGSRNRQCIAFIEAKGRQCVRWANEGDVYCCVHLASRFASSIPKSEVTLPVDAPLCEGTTVLGTRCKHRSLVGSSFCKKHRPKNGLGEALHSLDNKLKRKHDDIISRSASTPCKDVLAAEDTDTPLRVDPVSSMEREAFCGKSSLIVKLEHHSRGHDIACAPCCIGTFPVHGGNPCLESPKRHSLYCEKHLPSWLKRARNGKSRIVSKEVFICLLRECSSQEQKIQLHQACELFYRLFKSILSLRNTVPKEIQLQWAITEASKDPGVGEFLMKLVCSEKDRLMRLWGFDADKDAPLSSVVEDPAPISLAFSTVDDVQNTITCKICSEQFLDEQTLGSHWMDIHKKEAQWLFRGYACAICLDSFTNKKVLETHVQERHHVQFVEHCMLIQCIPCGSHFGNTELLWQHVLSVHLAKLRLPNVVEKCKVDVDESSPRKLELDNLASPENSYEGQGGFRKFICRFCGLKFDLLPDLGRHHQAAHMGPHTNSPHPSKRKSRFYSYRLKSGRLNRPRFKKGLRGASYRIRNRISATMKKCIQAPNAGGNSAEIRRVKSQVADAVILGNLSEVQCSDVARILFSEIKKTKPRPSTLDILSIARSACCKVSLQVSLEGKYGILPQCLYLKAAKLCSEHNIRVNWHQEGFICPKGCKQVTDQNFTAALLPRTDEFVQPMSGNSVEPTSDKWEIDECHYVIDSRHFGQNLVQKYIILCSDISFGKESVPIACVVEKDFIDSFTVHEDGTFGQFFKSSTPWEKFTYVLKPSPDQSFDLKTKALRLGCACRQSTCLPETCEHVYLFDNDYEDAKDIFGKPMRGRFPYDDQGRIILQEGYLVYECNHLCSCSGTCVNRVLQNGVRVKVEVFKTEKKGWAVRAGEAIPRGTFICEYIGEVLSEHEANERRNRYGKDGCSYLYDIGDHNNDMSRLIKGQAPYVIDATRYGNVSRFINHCCSPNLFSHQVLVESMDYQLAHIGLYAGRDIAVGEELTHDYKYKLQPGEGCPCHCGSSNCRGRLY